MPKQHRSLASWSTELQFVFSSEYVCFHMCRPYGPTVTHRLQDSQSSAVSECREGRRAGGKGKLRAPLFSLQFWHSSGAYVALGIRCKIKKKVTASSNLCSFDIASSSCREQRLGCNLDTCSGDCGRSQDCSSCNIAHPAGHHKALQCNQLRAHNF